VATSTEAPPTGTPARRRVPILTRVDFWLDSALFVAFALDYSIRFTGLTVHEWIGIGLGFALIVHVTLHWGWVLRTTRKLLADHAGREKLRWVVDLLLIGAMALCIGSGVLISRSALPALGLETVRDPFWTGLHTTAADICVILVAIHIALSWRWILAVGRRIMFPPRAASGTAR